MATTENTPSLSSTPSPIGLPEFLADYGRLAPDEQLQYLVGMAKKLTAKSPERATDAARVILHIKDNELYRKDHVTFEAFLEAEGLKKTTAYTTMAAVRRFPLEMIFEMGLTKARRLATEDDAEAIIAKGFDYLAEDGTVQHMSVLGNSTRAFQQAFKTRQLPPAAKPAAPADHSAEAATSANTEPEAGDQVAERIEEQSAPDPAPPSSETTSQEEAPADELRDEQVGAEPALQSGESGPAETSPATDPAEDAGDEATPDPAAAKVIEQPAASTTRPNGHMSKREKRELRMARATSSVPGADHASEALALMNG
ncbi:MAG: hypothetical protein FJZ01_10670 [Candidatus Sericytochromatia bacterium]|nr:hypothetical protein [Candidatus Tanganyikabacteria bacterium]